MKKIIKYLAIVSSISIMLLLLTNCGEKKNEVEAPTGPNTLTKAEIADGWELLFDGKSFEGWRGIGIEGVPEGHWKIVNGAIQKIASGDVPTKADGQPVKGGDLITKKTYQYFNFNISIPAIISMILQHNVRIFMYCKVWMLVIFTFLKYRFKFWCVGVGLNNFITV